jgi:WD40 repeat protein/tRNA A-37 threonylcarbamoyl transferase component Bud32
VAVASADAARTARTAVRGRGWDIAGRSLLQRFRHEAQVLGQLRHPGIAQIYEAGTADSGEGGRPFFAMELVDGAPLLEYASTHGLDTTARLDLIARLCDALHHAHQKGVVHRDLKPANILVTIEETTTSSAAGPHPKILDFGVARATDADLQTVTVHTTVGQLVGTVPYMSPEQASGDPDSIDIRSDVYAIGVIAYELLAGRLPYDVRNKLVHEAVRVIREDEPSRLSATDRHFRGDVETILAKALEKEKDRRYQSAAELAGDIRRFLNDEPIEARPASALYQARKFARRNKGLVGGVAATLLVAIGGAVIAARYALVATQRANALERTSYISGIAAAVSALEQHDFATAAAYMEQAPAEHRGWEYDYLRARLVRHLDEWPTPAGLVTPPVFDVDGRRMFAVTTDRRLCTWDVAARRLERTVTLEAIDLTYPPVLNGRSLRYAAATPDGDIVIGDLETGERLVELPTRDAPGALPYAWDDDGRRLFYRANGSLIWEPGGARPLAETRYSRGAFTHRGDRIVGTSRYQAVLIDATTGETLAEHLLDDIVTGVGFSPDDDTLAVVTHYRNVHLLDGRTLAPRARLVGHQDRVLSVAWRGANLVTASEDGTVRVWDPDRMEATAVLLVDEDASAPNVISRDEDGTGAIGPWVSFMPGGEEIIVSGRTLRRYRVDDPTVLRGHDTFVYHAAFSPDGRLVATSGFRQETIFLWDVHEARLVRRLDGPETERHRGSDMHSAAAVAFSEDGRRLVAGTRQETVNWDVETGARLPVGTDERLDERFLETLGRRHDVRITAYTTFGPRGRHLWDLLGPDRPDMEPAYTAISPDGTMGAACRYEGTVEVYDEGNPVPRTVLTGHRGVAYCAAFTPDGTRIATGGNDATIRIWDPRTGEQLLVLRGHDQYVKDLDFSPDGTMLVSVSGDGTVRLWDTVPRHVRMKRATAPSTPR